MVMMPYERWITLLPFFTALQLRNCTSAGTINETRLGRTVSVEDPRCEHEGDVLFCDYGNNAELVEMGYSLGRSIRRVFILNAGNVLLNSSVCVDIKFQNVSRVYVTDGESKSCESIIHLSAVHTKLDRVPEHIRKIYIEDSVVDILETQSGLQMLIVLNSKIRTLYIPTPLTEGTVAVLQDSEISSLHSIIVSNRSSIIFRKTIIDKILERALVVHSGGKIKLDHSSINNVTKGGIILAPEGYVVIKNFSGSLEMKGFSLKETLNCAKDRVQMQNTEVTEASISLCECIAEDTFKVGLFILTFLLIASLLVNVVLLYLLMKKNNIIQELKLIRIGEDSALMNIKEHENLEINDRPTNQITEVNMIPSNNASTYSDEKLDNNEVTDDLNATDKGLFPEELQKKTIVVLEKLDHIQNKIRKAEESILSESDKSCNLESKNEDFHRRTDHFDNHFDKRIKTLTRHENAIIQSSKRGQDGLLQSISQLKTSLGKAKGATRAYLEYRAKLLAIRGKSHCDEKIKKYEEIIFDVLMLLKEIGSSLATIGLQSKTNIFLNYVHDKYESLFEAQKLDYKKRHETEIRECFENNGRTELDEHRDVYDKPFPNGDFESEIFSEIEKIPDCMKIPEELFDGSLHKLSVQISKKTEIIHLALSHEEKLLSHKQSYLREIDCNSSIVLGFLKNTLSILIKLLTANSTGNEPRS